VKCQFSLEIKTSTFLEVNREQGWSSHVTGCQQTIIVADSKWSHSKGHDLSIRVWTLWGQQDFRGGRGRE